jgi:hypothetical protein
MPTNPDAPDVLRGNLEPPVFQGHLTEDQLEGFDKQTRRVLINLSRVEQKTEWNTQVLLEIHGYLVARQTLRKRIEKFVVVAFGTSILATWGKKFADWLAR